MWTVAGFADSCSDSADFLELQSIWLAEPIGFWAVRAPRAAGMSHACWTVRGRMAKWFRLSGTVGIV